MTAKPVWLRDRLVASVLVGCGLAAAPPVTIGPPVQVPPAELLLHVTGPEHRFLGREAEFDIDVVPLNDAADNVQVTAEVPEALTFVSANRGGKYFEKTRQVRWSLGRLSEQLHRGLTLRLRAEGAGSATVLAGAWGDGISQVDGEASVSVDAVPSMLLEISDSDDPVAVGAETQYEIRVVNLGSCSSSRLQLFVAVPEGLTPLDANAPTKAQIEGQQVIFAALPHLAPRAEAVYRLRARACHPGDWRVKVQMFSDQLRIPLGDEETTRVFGE